MEVDLQGLVAWLRGLVWSYLHAFRSCCPICDDLHSYHVYLDVDKAFSLIQWGRVFVHSCSPTDAVFCHAVDQSRRSDLQGDVVLGISNCLEAHVVKGKYHAEHDFE